jgi:hypothetical protein
MLILLYVYVDVFRVYKYFYHDMLYNNTAIVRYITYMCMCQCKRVI